MCKTLIIFFFTPMDKSYETPFWDTHPFFAFHPRKIAKTQPRVFCHKVMADATKGTAELEAKQDSDMKAKGCWVSNNKKKHHENRGYIHPQIVHFLIGFFPCFFFESIWGVFPQFSATPGLLYLKLRASLPLKNGWLEDETSFWGQKTAYFQVRAVRFRECNTVDGRNPANQLGLVVNIPQFPGFLPKSRWGGGIPLFQGNFGWWNT